MRGTNAKEYFETSSNFAPIMRQAIVEGLIPMLSRPGSATGYYASTLPSVEPLVVDAGNVAVAFSYRKSDTDKFGAYWWVSDLTQRHELWIDAVFKVWSEMWPDTFGQAAGDWTVRAEWQSAGERKANATRDAFESEAAARTLQIQKERESISTLQDSARAATNKGERRLLTSNGHELVAAVADALTRLGFRVTDQDAIADRSKSAKYEDLRIESPDEQDWAAIAEVKGYRGTAKSSDLQQVRRAAQTYERSVGKPPQAMWYVVNQLMGNDPEGRPAVLASNPDDVAIFAEDGGLLLDTAELFRLLAKVELEEVKPRAARSLLVRSSGVLHVNSSV